MFEPETAAFLETGCSLIVATVSPHGEPTATRGWGMTVLSRAEPSVRVLLPGDDAASLEQLRAGGQIAMTAANVRTLHSVQMKGRATAVEPATDEDRARSQRYCDDFFTDVLETDGTSRQLLERLVPIDLVACTVTVDELYDQTPGPNAGGAMTGTR